VGSGKTAVNIWAHLILNPVLVLALLFPWQAEASILSFITNLFTSPSVEAQEIDSNVQNMPLLEAIASPSPNSTSTKDKTSIVSGNSLAPETSLPAQVKSNEDDQISIYVVHSGDTLPAIAKMFGVSVNTIRWGNDLKNNTITPGQTLVILPISGIQHVVKSGDTLESIAKQHKGDLDEILQYNNLTRSSKLAIGDVIVVPDGESTVVSSGGSSNNGSVNSGGSSNTVYEGYYLRPIVGGVKTQGIHGHNGVDLASSYGANILASADGQVIISRNSGWNGGYGSYIVINHKNGTQTLYAHLSGTAVSVGDFVKQGQVIGYMGHSGQVSGPTGTHLHFEIRGARNPF
jgi:LysM repeat protein